MADPVSWMYIAAAVVSAMGAVTGAEAEAANAEAEAKTAGINAEHAAAQAAQAEDAKRKSNREMLAKQRAAFGESGIVPDSGTALGVQSQSEIAAELDALNIRYEGMLSRTNYLNQRSQARSRARSARTSGYLSAAASLLGGAAGAAGRAAPAAGGSLEPLSITARRIPTAPRPMMGPL